ncbi:hypothetical protein [Georgenia sp. SYP-B2076]|uniref:hypothetical protein n=1 Tax=Georgenia sp. SYP-B2076 TaxID=2495881 RepID=UPI000F8E29C9|nr:hypothetical protein [Georgenia sp. SYP-B2076]
MIPLGPGPVPTTGEELAARARGALGHAWHLGGTPVVDADVSAQGEVDRIAIDISGTSIDAAHLHPRAAAWHAPAGRREGETTVRSLDVRALPVLVAGAPVTVRADAVNVVAEWVRAEGGDLWLVPKDAASTAEPTTGHVLVTAAVSDLEAAARTIGAEVARSKGVTLQELHLRPQPAGHNAVRGEVQAKAAKGFMSSRVVVGGHVQVDDALVLRVVELQLDAGGIVGKVAEGLLRPRIEPWRGKSVDLSARTFAGARLTALEIGADDQFRLEATFGS